MDKDLANNFIDKGFSDKGLSMAAASGMGLMTVSSFNDMVLSLASLAVNKVEKVDN